MTVVKSPASTAKLLDTELIALIVDSRNLISPPAALDSLENCRNTAIAASVESCILLKVAANVVCANTSKACFVFSAEKPACAKVRATLNNSPEDAPKVRDNLVTSSVKPVSCRVLLPVT